MVKKKIVHMHRDRIFKLIKIHVYIKTGHNIVMKSMFGSGFSTYMNGYGFQKY
jgi:hypothetical protein